ncbi:Calcium-dependent protein kinase 18 [Sarracenia purpurea var. burkii]
MGSCVSTIKVSGSNSNPHSTTATTATVTVNRRRKESTKPQSTETNTTKNRDGSHYNQQKTQESHKRNSNQSNPKRQCGVIPCGKRTDFGYAKDFDKRYTIGKLLGHGQFGYTYVAVDMSNGDRVAVKRIDKKKMVLPIAVEDVKREVKILQALAGHENVVQFYNAFEDDSYVYIVME